MKYQVFFSLKTIIKYSRLSSAAVMIGALRVKGNTCNLLKANSILLKLTRHSPQPPTLPPLRREANMSVTELHLLKVAFHHTFVNLKLLGLVVQCIICFMSLGFVKALQYLQN